jgi:hypothetical protein
MELLAKRWRKNQNGIIGQAVEEESEEGEEASYRIVITYNV